MEHCQVSRCSKESVTHPTGGLQELIEGGEEDRMIDWERECDVAHVARAMYVVETTCPTHILFVTGSKSWVIQSSKVGVQETVKGIWVSNFLDTHGSQLRGRVGPE